MNNDTNSPDMDMELKALWSHECCPIIDGILFGDGRVNQISVAWEEQADGRHRLVIEPGGWTTLEALRRKGPVFSTSISENCDVEDSAKGIRVLGGEGALGADGFVAVIRIDSGEIEWIAFFQESNPFVAVQIHEDFVLAKTSHEMWWRFPLDSPEQVTLLQEYLG